MAQKQVQLRKIAQQINKSTQTAADSAEFSIYLSRYKFIRVYKSKAYKEHVISFNFGKSKKYILSRSMWKILFKNIDQINEVLEQQPDTKAESRTA